MKINRNIAWAESFVNELAAGGVKHVCISPGSRNTPLTWAFAHNNNIKKYVLIDERSSAFFALGLANKTSSPVALVCTSGTASVEFYPAIVEAFQQRIPLIICTADRPPELRNTGTNQTINQDNLYKNHIRWFADAGLPQLSKEKIVCIKKLAHTAIEICSHKDTGPVHINFPFRKPFEPDNPTDDINNKIYLLLNKTLFKLLEIKRPGNQHYTKQILPLVNKFVKLHKGLIIVGPENYNNDFNLAVIRLSNSLGYPILADGSSQLRYCNVDTTKIPDSVQNPVICNYEGMLRSPSFLAKFNPEVVIHFGRTPTSKGLEDFYEKYSPFKIIINNEGDIFDPSRKGKIIRCSPSLFCKIVLENLPALQNQGERNYWSNIYSHADQLLEQFKIQNLFKSPFPSEVRIINEFLNTIPDNSCVMLSNSLPVRDFDFFASRFRKNLRIFHNRGASGIDGILSTALGIASVKNNPTFLITGDIAFYYDINALLAARKYAIPLVIILINNNGGGIFNVLPVSKYPRFLNEYFITPHNLHFGKLTKAFGIKYTKAKSWDNFIQLVVESFSGNEACVIEIKTDSPKSARSRKDYWSGCNKILNEFIVPPKTQQNN